MNKLALRENSGDWIYYLTSLTYKEVAENVKKIDDELHTSKTLSDMIQRSLTDNVEKIARYIESQPEHFFNALVLAVYDGDPQWREIKLDYGDGETYELGVLEFSGDEKIFPVDGQHRVEGIKRTLSQANGHDFEKETIPVIFIGHKCTADGMQRTRRLFSTLNRYAKPVSLNDIIALDEDDIVAIITRHLIELHPLFKEERLNNHKQKAIPDKDKTAFTNIISLYECNVELLKYFIRDEEVFVNNKKLAGKSKIDAYCRFRRNDEEIDAFLALVDDYWNAFTNNISHIQRYLTIAIDNNPAHEFRNSDGGVLLFRPVGQRPFVMNAIGAYSILNNFDIVMQKMNAINWDLNCELWTFIVWNPITKKMITSSNAKTIYLLIKYLLNIESLSEKEKNDLIDLYRGAKGDENLTDSQILELINRYRLR